MHDSRVARTAVLNHGLDPISRHLPTNLEGFMVMTDVNLQETSPMTAIVLVVSTSRRSMYTHHRTEKSIEHNIAGWLLGQAVMPPPLTSHLSISPHKQSAAWLSLPRRYCQLKSKSCNPRDHRVNLALFGAHFPEIHERIVIRKKQSPWLQK